jgi:predicted transcriptional regulator
MRVIWNRERSTAEDVRNALSASQPMKDSTVRTVLRRLEAKGYATHVTEGRTFIYRPRVESRSVAADAVRSIVDRFCAGSVEDLLVGMVDDEIVSSQKLKQLAERIAKAEAAKRKPKSN